MHTCKRGGVEVGANTPEKPAKEKTPVLKRWVEPNGERRQGGNRRKGGKKSRARLPLHAARMVTSSSPPPDGPRPPTPVPTPAAMTNSNRSSCSPREKLPRCPPDQDRDVLLVRGSASSFCWCCRGRSVDVDAAGGNVDAHEGDEVETTEAGSAKGWRSKSCCGGGGGGGCGACCWKEVDEVDAIGGGGGSVACCCGTRFGDGVACASESLRLSDLRYSPWWLM